MVVNGRPLKRMKRRVTADFNDFLTFSVKDSSVAGGPFRRRVKVFLTNHARLPSLSSHVPHLLTWQILFRVGDSVPGEDSSPTTVCLDIVEEDVARSRSVYCDQCRVVGWSGNPVCSKRYHFIIKADGGSIGGYNKSCAGCGEILHLSESRCKTCNHVMTTKDVEDWMYSQLEDTTHLLHGVVHANGYGHLLRVNGREGGSRILPGRQIMDFWDRLCKTLAVRKVSVMDVSKKYGMEFRLLHAITKGHPWYGEWGYEFGAGSFALTREAYNTAVETLSNLPLNIFLSQGRKPRTLVQDLIAFYQSLSEQELVNIRDLFCFMMTLIHDAHKSTPKADLAAGKKAGASESMALCAWTKNDVIRVEEAMFKVLRAVTGPNWVSWRSLKGAACRVGSPGLLDYCLKNLEGKHAADGMVVNARCIPDSGAVEYRLERGNSPNGSATSNNPPMASCPSEDRLLRDLRYMYGSILHPQTMLSSHSKFEIMFESATKLLDCKQFLKNFKPVKTNPSAIHISCEVDLTDPSSEEPLLNPPPELIILPSNATISDLKQEATKAFQEVYLLLKGFEVDKLVGYGGVDESTQVKLLLGSSEEFVKVRGKGVGKNGLSRFRMERGIEPWTVDCCCGARDDDGERMLACDVCEVWRHTRCSGIPDSNTVPARFVCRPCVNAGFGDSGGGPVVALTAMSVVRRSTNGGL